MNYNVKFNNYGVLSILSDCIYNNKRLFFKQGKKLYFNYEGEELTKDEALEQYYTTSDQQTLKKRPSKKWCIEEIKSHFINYGCSWIDECVTEEPFYSLAQELIEKHKL